MNQLLALNNALRKNMTLKTIWSAIENKFSSHHLMCGILALLSFASLGTTAECGANYPITIDNYTTQAYSCDAANQQMQIFVSLASANVTLSSCSFENIDAGENLGAAIKLQCASNEEPMTLVITSCKFIKCGKTNKNAGAIDLDSRTNRKTVDLHTITCSDSTFEQNHANNSGSCLYARNVKLASFTNCIITKCACLADHNAETGAIWITTNINGSLSFTNCVFTENSNTACVALKSQNNQFENCSFTSNIAQNYGKDIPCIKAITIKYLEVNNCTFADNSLTSKEKSINSINVLTDATVKISKSFFTNSKGSDINLGKGKTFTITFDNCSFARSSDLSTIEIDADVSGSIDFTACCFRNTNSEHVDHYYIESVDKSPKMTFTFDKSCCIDVIQDLALNIMPTMEYDIFNCSDCSSTEKPPYVPPPPVDDIYAICPRVDSLPIQINNGSTFNYDGCNFEAQTRLFRINADDCSIVIRNCIFKNSFVGYGNAYGGGTILFTYGYKIKNVEIHDCTIENCGTSKNNGGIVYIDVTNKNETLNLDNQVKKFIINASTITNAYAYREGAAVWISGALQYIVRSCIVRNSKCGNTNKYNGGIFYAEPKNITAGDHTGTAEMKILYTTFMSCERCISCRCKSMTITGCEFQHCYCTNPWVTGAAVNIITDGRTQSLLVEYNLFQNCTSLNESIGGGAALGIGFSDEITIRYNRFEDCISNSGGSMYIYEAGSSEVLVEHNTFTGGNADIFLRFGVQAEISNNQFTKSQKHSSIYGKGANITVSKNCFSASPDAVLEIAHFIVLVDNSTLIIGEDNCFNLTKDLSISDVDGEIIGDGTGQFECNDCKLIHTDVECETLVNNKAQLIDGCTFEDEVYEKSSIVNRIYGYNVPIVLISCTFSNLSIPSSKLSGGIAISSYKLTLEYIQIINCTFNNMYTNCNRSAVIYFDADFKENYLGSFFMTESTITDATSNAEGSAIWISGALQFVIEESTISNCVCILNETEGGAIYIGPNVYKSQSQATTANIVNTKFTSNNRCITSRSNRLNITECLFKDCYAMNTQFTGGAIFIPEGANPELCIITYSQFENCSYINETSVDATKGRGGAIYIDNSKFIHISRNVFDGNNAGSGSSLYISRSQNIVDISNNTFQNGYAEIFMRNDVRAVISLNKFHKTQLRSSFYSSGTVNAIFSGNCFTVAHNTEIYSAHYIVTGGSCVITVDATNCFDQTLANSVKVSDESVLNDKGSYECTTCSSAECDVSTGTLTNCFESFSTRPYYNSALNTLTFTKCTFSNMYHALGSSPGGGSIVFSYSVSYALVKFDSCSISQCGTSRQNGGSVYIQCQAKKDTAGTFDELASFQLINTVIVDAHSQEEGAAVWIEGAKAYEVSNCIISDSSCYSENSDNGVLFARTADKNTVLTTAMTITNTTFINCQRCVYSLSDTFSVKGCQFNNCYTLNNTIGGGALFIPYIETLVPKTLTVEASVFNNCSYVENGEVITSSRGGAVFCSNTNAISFTGNTFDSCIASSGGSIYINVSSTQILINDNTFTNGNAEIFFRYHNDALIENNKFEKSQKRSSIFGKTVTLILKKNCFTTNKPEEYETAHFIVVTMFSSVTIEGDNCFQLSRRQSVSVNSTLKDSDQVYNCEGCIPNNCPSTDEVKLNENEDASYKGCTFTFRRAFKIFNSGASLSIILCRFKDLNVVTDKVQSSGGAVLLSYGYSVNKLHIKDCVIENCVTENWNGGAVYIDVYNKTNQVTFMNEFLMNGTSISNVVSGSSGAAIYIKGSKTYTVENCDIRNSRCISDQYPGGVLYAGPGYYNQEYNTEVSVKRTTFSINTRCISALAKSLTVSECIFTDCYFANSTYTGGAIYVPYDADMKELVVENSIFYNNSLVINGKVDSASGKGGAIFISRSKSITVQNNTFDSCLTSSGGAMWINVSESVTVKYNLFNGCNSDVLTRSGTNITIDNNRFIKTNERSSFFGKGTTATFTNNCFITQTEEIMTVHFIIALESSTVTIGEGNTFNKPKDNSISVDASSTLNTPDNGQYDTTCQAINCPSKNIYVKDYYQATGCTYSDSSANRIYRFDTYSPDNYASMKLVKCTFTNVFTTSSDAQLGGGSVVFTFGRNIELLQVIDCSFDKCGSNNYRGGVIYVNIEEQKFEFKQFVCSSSTFSGATIELEGSAIWIGGATSYAVTECTFDSCACNDDDSDGGAIYIGPILYQSTGITSARVISSVFINDKRSIVANVKTLTVTGCQFKNCYAYNLSITAAAIYVTNISSANYVGIEKNEFVNCTVASKDSSIILARKGYGATIYVTTINDISIRNNTFQSGISGSGGSIYLKDIAKKAMIYYNSFKDGNAEVFIAYMDVDIVGNSFYKSQDRSSLYFRQSNATIDNNNFTLKSGTTLFGGAHYVVAQQNSNINITGTNCFDQIKEISVTSAESTIVDNGQYSCSGGGVQPTIPPPPTNPPQPPAECPVFDQSGSAVNLGGQSLTYNGCQWTYSSVNRVFKIFDNPDTLVTFKQCSFTNFFVATTQGTSSAGGSVMFSYGQAVTKIEFDTCTFTNCYTEKNSAGIIYVDANSIDEFSMKGTTIKGARSSVDGAAVYVTNAYKFTISSCTIENSGCDTVDGDGGVFFARKKGGNQKSDMIFINTLFKSCKRAITSLSTTLSVEGCTFEKCTFGSETWTGGAIFVSDGAGSTAVTVKGSKFTECTSTAANQKGKGAAILIGKSDSITIDGNTFSKCMSSSGSSIYIYESLNQAQILNNAFNDGYAEVFLRTGVKAFISHNKISKSQERSTFFLKGATVTFDGNCFKVTDTSKFDTAHFIVAVDSSDVKILDNNCFSQPKDKSVNVDASSKLEGVDSVYSCSDCSVNDNQGGGGKPSGSKIGLSGIIGIVIAVIVVILVIIVVVVVVKKKGGDNYGNIPEDDDKLTTEHGDEIAI